MSETVEVTKEDANNYCRVLAALGLEEEGDPMEAIDRLRAENASASSRAEYWKAEHLAGNAEINSLRSQVEALQRRCEGLEKALMFYRDQWQPDYIGDPDVAMRLFSEPTEALLRDEGEIAAKVLSQELRGVLRAALAGETGKAGG